MTPEEIANSPHRLTLEKSIATLTDKIDCILEPYLIGLPLNKVGKHVNVVVKDKIEHFYYDGVEFINIGPLEVTYEDTGKMRPSLEVYRKIITVLTPEELDDKLLKVKT